MRKASIHIYEEQLASLLKSELADMNITKVNCDKLAISICQQAKLQSLSTRALFITNDKQKRDAAKVSMAGMTATSTFITTIILVRRQLKHRGLQMPKPGTQEYLAYKEPAKLAMEFCEEFGLKTKEGFKAYCQIAISKMKNFSVPKIRSMHESIVKEYEAREAIRLDPDPEQTEVAHELYRALVAERVGYSQSYKDLPEKYACFVEVAKRAKELRLALHFYMKSQFDAMDWRSGLPDPYQLVGLKADERVFKYCYENNIKLGGLGANKKKVDFEALKRI